MPHIPRTVRQRPRMEPTDIALLTTPEEATIFNLPMTLTPVSDSERPVVPKTDKPKKVMKRPGIERISIKKWDKDPDEIARLIGLE